MYFPLLKLRGPLLGRRRFHQRFPTGRNTFKTQLAVSVRDLVSRRR